MRYSIDRFYFVCYNKFYAIMKLSMILRFEKRMESV